MSSGDSWAGLVERVERLWRTGEYLAEGAGWRELAELFPLPILLRRRGRIVYANEACFRRLGVEHRDALIGHLGIELVHPADRESTLQQVQAQREAGSRVEIVDARIVRPDGGVYDTQSVGVLITYEGSPAVLSVMLDVSDRRRLQEQRHTAQRLVSLGTLAAGIAHEINNPLTAIMMAARVGMDAIEGDRDDRTVRQAFDDILRRASHVAAIVRNVLSFAREGISERSRVDLNEVIREAIGLVPPSPGRPSMEVRLDLVDGPCEVLADPMSLRQVIVNLVTNAIEASEGRPQITVRTERSRAGIRLTVSDRGRGMSPEEVRRAFDPFFTTRVQGTGLGLSIVHEIVRAHGGSVRLESESGKGTSVLIDLPAPPPGVETAGASTKR